MPRQATKPKEKERRTAAAPSGSSLSPHTSREADFTPDHGEISTRVATCEPGPTEAVVIAITEAPGTTGGPTPVTDPSHYEVVHAAVGGHYKGECVEAVIFTDEQSRRLLNAGAIIPLYKAD